ncbi:MAG: tetratricopeptide repeat-containing glycosyltransferase family protein [Bdellovibrionales bacterium]
MATSDDQNIQALFQKGFDFHRQGKFAEAERFYRETLRLAPKHFDALHLLGLLALQSGKAQEGVTLIEQAIASNPNVAAAYNNLGNGLKTLGHCDAALEKFDKAIELEPKMAEAHDNRGNTLSDLKRYDEAQESYTHAINLKPDFAEALFHRGNAFRCLGRFEEALADYGRVVGLRPDFAGAFCNRGNALKELNRYKEALESFKAATQLRPNYAEALFNLGMCELQLGEFEKGWEHYEWRKKSTVPAAARRYVQPAWKGENLAQKTLFVYSEQGFGDTIQFCRYVQRAEKLNASVIVAAPKPLHRLLSPLHVIDEDKTPPHFDYHCAMLSLPMVFKTTLDTIPAEIPYLSADKKEVDFFRTKLLRAKKTRIGFVWAGTPRNERDCWRSLKFEQALPLFENSAVEWISLQHFVPESDVSALAKSGIINWGKDFADFAAAAAAIMALDLVISVDTAVAHLAGALGKPVWILLPFSSDWRWLTERDDTPWYPTARLFRQSKRGEWENVIKEVATEVGRLSQKE